MRHAIAVILLAPCFAAAIPARAGEAEVGEAVLELGKSLSALRAEVEALSDEAEAARAEAREEGLALARRKAALSGDLDEARLLEAELSRRLEGIEESVATRTSAADSLKTPVTAAVARLRAGVIAGLPVKTRERLGKLDDVVGALDAEGPARGASLLHAFIESELELAKTSQRARAPITLDGKPVVADVIRLGLVAMYFRTGAGVVGFAARDAEGKVAWRALDDGEDRARVHALFDSWKKGTPSGVVVIPLPPTQGPARKEAP